MCLLHNVSTLLNSCLGALKLKIHPGCAQTRSTSKVLSTIFRLEKLIKQNFHILKAARHATIDNLAQPEIFGKRILYHNNILKYINTQWSPYNNKYLNNLEDYEWKTNIVNYQFIYFYLYFNCKIWINQVFSGD